MAEHETLTADAVRETLHALRYTRSLTRSPLIDLDLVTREIGMEGFEDTPAMRSWVLAKVMAEAVARELAKRRGLPLDLDAVLEADAVAGLESDFSSDSVEREAWGALYFRYLADVSRPVQRAADLGISQSTLYRRVKWAAEQLAAVLSEQELGARDATPSGQPSRLSLPTHGTTLVGRSADIAAVRRLLDATRLLTLTGPGGTGKTRLALAVARAAGHDYPDGAWFVDLSSLTDDDLVPVATGAVLGLRERPGETMVDSLVGALRDQELLLVLDNCEHVAYGATRLVERILRGAPGVQLLTTSREPLRAMGERVWSVPPLRLPAMPDDGETLEPDGLVQASAVRLFVERASDHDTAFSLNRENAAAVARLCIALDGLPLALELSAVRARMLSPAQQLERFEELFQLLGGGRRLADPRQRTLESAFEWSYKLLSEEEQRLFGRLAVFRGGWTLEAAEAVASFDGVEGWDVLGLLGGLIEKSLVTTRLIDGRRRYGLLVTVRTFAKSKLEASSQGDEVRRRHLQYYVDFTDEAAAGIRGDDQSVWIGRLNLEHDNIRAALGYAARAGLAESALQLGCGLGWSFYVRGLLTEGRRLLTQVLEVPGAEDHPRLRARSLKHLGTLASHQGDYTEAREYLDAALRVFQSLGDAEGAAGILNNLGVEAIFRGDYEAAERHLEEAVDLGGKRTNFVANLGLVALRRGDYHAARDLYRQTLGTARDQDDAWMVGHTLINLGSIEHSLGNLDAAEALFQEGLDIKHELKDRTTMVYALQALGGIATERGDLSRARECLAAATELAQEVGDKHGQMTVVFEMVALALAAEDPTRAASLLAATDAAREALDVEPSPQEAGKREAYEAAIREQIDQAAYTSAYDAGAWLDLDAAAELGLESGPM